MSKKEKRLESKKRKAIALLNLIETRVLREDKMDGPEPKRTCLSTNDYESNNPNCTNQTNRTTASSTDYKTGKQQPCSETSDEAYARAKKLQRELQKAADAHSGTGKTQQNVSRYGPKINLWLENMVPFGNVKDGSKGTLEDRLPPLFMVDLQHLLLLAMLKNFSFWAPRWCRLNRPRKLSSVVLVILQDVSITDFEEHPDCFSFLKNSFLSCVEMVSPVQYHSCVEKEISRVPLLISQLKCYTNRKDIREKVIRLISKSPETSDSHSKTSEKTETVCTSPQAAAETDGQMACPESKESAATSGCDDTFPRTSLLLSSTQLMQEGYPLPIHCKNKRYEGYAFSKDSYRPVTPHSPMFAVDCEMCETSQKAFELTRVSVVNEVKEVVYDQLVKPYNEITNYLTPFSGMTEERLSSVTKRVEDVQRELKALLPPDAILCGQSLWNDLNALKMFHPYVIDTSIIFNQSGDKKIRCGLRKLALNFLGRKIQGSKQGHCSIEDAKATMDLVKLKLSKDIEFGDAMLGGVYFPNIKTYFQNPDKAQNVEETFSAHPHPPSTPPPHPEPSNHSLSPSSLVLTHPSSTCPQNGSSVHSHESMDADCQPAQKAEGCVRSVESQSQETEKGGLEEQAHQCNVECSCGASEERKDVENGQYCQGEMGQCEAFFQQEGGTIVFNFFELVVDNRSRAGVVGSKDFLRRLQPHPKVERVEVENDSEACAAAPGVSQRTNMTWVQLTSMARQLSSKDTDGCGHAASGEDERKVMLTNLDGHVKDLVSQLQTQSLVAVLMTGRKEGRQHFNAATFLKMT